MRQYTLNWSLSRWLRVWMLLVFVLTMPNSGRTQDLADPARFWTWFKSRESELAKLFSYETGAAAQKDPKLQKKVNDSVAEVAENLRKIHPKFSPFFGFSEGINKLTITVNGAAEHFKSVDAFIATAPEIGRWRFIALKQPLNLPADTEIQSGTAKLKVGDWRYTKAKNVNGKFDLAIYIPNKVSDPEGFRRLFTTLTKDFLGERFASTAVGTVTVRQLGSDAPAGLLPFVDIHKDVSREVKSAQ